MTSEPQAPKAPAIYLYRQVDRDDTSPDETVYVRIKILTEEGRKYANVEIPYFRDSESIRAIQARTIKPNGEISVFNGQIFDNTVVKYRGQRYINKTFTIPDVPVGSIIEYQFRRDMAEYYVFNSRWILSADLFTKHAKFSLQRYTGFSLRWTWPYGLPPGTDPPKEVRDVIRLETHDVPAFVSEDYMPPEDLMKYRVEFIYESTDNDERESAAYWKHYGKRRFHDVEDFVDARRAMAGAVAQVVAPDDPPEVKLQKLYARVQQIRNISFERDKTAEEEKREHLKPIGDVGDVWKRGYGNGEQITWLLLALARAAGLQADALLVATRDQYFFNPDEMNGNQLNTNVVVVKLNDKDVFLDPGTAFTPYGVLPWSETGVTGLRLSKDGGNWQTIPMPLVAQSKVLCQGRMQLKDNGTLEGKLTLTFTGYEAQTLRLEERH
ncbi:MAG: DUF3857 domain-containing protein, partial [Proteobacteria bacterium]|nr:DUF3857 domain-containing protein [Pseudomonadota bacterium]